MRDFLKLVAFVAIVFLLGYWYRGEYVVVPPSTTNLPEIARSPTDLPPPITRKENKRVVISLETSEMVALLSPGVSYEYWTFNQKVPGPFIRVMEGDTVEVHLTHTHTAGHSHVSLNDPFDSLTMFLTTVARADVGHTLEVALTTPVEDAHLMPSSVDTTEHDTHSIDLHAVIGPGGGAMLAQTKPNETSVFEFKATRPGLYIYHCASPHIPTHVANGMYGMILVEPMGGLTKVDREFYVMQGEFYTKGKVGEKGFQALDPEKLLAGTPEYYVFNGRVKSLMGENALKAKTGEKIRLFFGVGTHLASNFHIIGGILGNLYQEGDFLSPPRKNVQTTIVPPGGAMMAEFTIEVPGTYLLVDHSLPRAIDRGALGELVITGPERPDIIKKVQ